MFDPTAQEIELLKQVQIGNEVAIKSPHNWIAAEWRIEKVDKITPHQLHVGPYRFWKKNGHQVGNSGYYGKLCYPLTDERRAEVEEATRDLAEHRHRQELIHHLHDIHWRDFDTASLEAVRALVEEAYNA